MKSVTRWEPRPCEGKVMSCWVQVVDMVVFGSAVVVEVGIESSSGVGDKWVAP